MVICWKLARIYFHLSNEAINCPGLQPNLHFLKLKLFCFYPMLIFLIYHNIWIALQMIILEMSYQQLTIIIACYNTEKCNCKWQLPIKFENECFLIHLYIISPNIAWSNLLTWQLCHLMWLIKDMLSIHAADANNHSIRINVLSSLTRSWNF